VGILVRNSTAQPFGNTSLLRSHEEGTYTKRLKKTEVWTQKLQFVTLNGDKIQFYSVEVDHTNHHMTVSCLFLNFQRPNHEFVIYRKDGIVEVNDKEKSFTLFVQDVNAKMR